MSNTVFMIKLVKRDTESDASFKMREHLYKKAIENHNLMVWSTLNHLALSNPTHVNFNSSEFHTHLKEYNNVNFIPYPGTVVNFETICQTDNRYKQHNPYFDSGFDIFQPLSKMKTAQTPEGESKSFELEPGSHLVKLGFKSAMYTLRSNRRGARLPDYKKELLRQITIYHNLRDISDETLGEYSTKRFNMVQKTDWHNMIPMPYKLHPRSSIYKKAIRQANCTGIIDTGYRGELCAAVDCLGYAYGKQSDSLRTTLEHNKRYFQICRADLQPFYVVLLNEQDELPSTERGEGGFGSTGR